MPSTHYNPFSPPAIGATWLNEVDEFVFGAQGPSGSSLVGFVQAGSSAVARTLQDKGREPVTAKDFGAIADGGSHPLSDRFASLALAQAKYPFVTSLTQQIDWAAAQAMSNHCSAVGQAQRLTAGTYNFGNDSVVLTQVLTDSYQIIGDGCGDAYDINPQAATIIETNGVDAFQMSTAFPTSAVAIHGVRFRGDELLKTGFLLNMPTVTRQLKNVWMTECIGTYVGGLVKATSASATNLAYLTMTRTYTWGCDKVVQLVNVPTTIFTIRDSLFHNCQNYALDIGLGAELSISDSWFESCNPAAIHKPTTNFLKLALHNVYFENNTPSLPNRTSMIFGANTDITLTGKTNLPGAFMTDNPFSLGVGCSLANYTTELVQIRGIGGLVKTPGTVRPHHLFESQLHIPYGSATPANSGDFLLGNTIAGELSAVAFAASLMPANILKDYCPARTAEVCRSNALVSPGAYASPGVLCAAFVYQSNNINNGLGLTAQFTTSAGTVQLDKTFSFPEESLDAPHFCVVTIPLAAGVTPTGVFIEGRANKWASYASVFSMVLDDQTLLNMLPLQGRIRKVTQTIATASNFVFTAQDRSAKPYSVTADVTINGGARGVYRINSYGTTTGGLKVREPSGTILAGTTVTPADGAAGDMLNLTVANTSGADVIAEFTWRY